MEVRLDGQAAIVTGAGAGIGRATALLLAERGARVLVNDGDAGRAEAVAAEIRSGGGEAIGEGSAVGSRDAARRIVERALASFGRLDTSSSTMPAFPVPRRSAPIRTRTSTSSST
jgi:3-oxoacyl-[acyl-carrier protein] reductase